MELHFLTFCALAAAAAPLPIDLSRYSPDCGVYIRAEADRLHVSWPIGTNEFGRAHLNFTTNHPVIERLAISSSASGPEQPLLQDVDAVTFLTVGTRQGTPGRPPEMSLWNEFFDKPGRRSFTNHVSRLQPKQVRVSSEGRRARVAVGGLHIGSFSGQLEFTFFATGRLVHVEAVVSTQEDRRAILYDAGLTSPSAGWGNFAWMDAEGRLQREPIESTDTPIAVRHRAVIAETAHGSVACFPPPHQFHFPRDWTDNLKFAWLGSNHLNQGSPMGFGIRQVPDGKTAFEPWFNAPPGTQQRLGVFYLLTQGPAEDALRETKRYTHGDRYPRLPGHFTFTSHYHMAVAVDAMARKFQGTPDFVRVFKEMGVNAVHIADFHGDGHPKDPGPLRLPEVDAMNKECRRLSDPNADFLLIPGEEINEFLGLAQPGRHPGHWMSLFPKPVYWTQKRAADQPFAETDASYGTVYRVGSRTDMMELLRRENGLAWVAHPRIKASSWTPDIFRHEDFYLADFWLGAAWKAMPADLSRDRLGDRGFDVLNDMANWGQHKYMPGEVDVFKIDRTHELYGHMNINYVRLDRLPRFDEGWQPILNALRRGDFFVTTGEILLHDFTLNGKRNGETLTLQPGQRPVLRVNVEWTFPLHFAEVISGDGEKVYRERMELKDTAEFGERALTLRPALEGRKWVRFEIWDIASNGAFTQPIWLEQAP